MHILVDLNIFFYIYISEKVAYYKANSIVINEKAD